MAGAIVITAEPPVPARNRMMIRPGMFCAKLHPKRKALKNQQEPTMTGHRPNISLMGARKRGPNEYPRRKMVIMKLPTASDGSCKSRSVKPIPGAKIDEPRGLIKVIAQMSIIFVFRFRAGQYLDVLDAKQAPV